LLIAWSVTAQTKDTLRIQLPAKKSYLPTGVRIGVDALSLIKSQVQKDFSGWEVTGDVDLDRYLVAGDLGNWARTFESDSGTYTNSGSYWRLGAQVNFLTKDIDKNVFFLGFYYGRSKFSEDLTIINNDLVYGPLTQDFANRDVKAGWAELTTGLKVKMFSFIWFGATARFKFGLGTQGEDEMLVHDVPGYGRTNKDSYWGFNYYIMARIPVRKQKQTLRIVK